MRTTANLSLSGIAVSPGLAAGKAFLFHDIFEREITGCAIDAHQSDAELARLEEAFVEVIAHLEEAAQHVADLLDSAVADIFRAHQAILEDDRLAAEIKGEIETELVCAEQAVQRVFRRWERRFRKSENQSLRQRGDDLTDLGRRLLRSLAGVHAHSLERMPEESVLVARRLLPSETVFLSHRSTAGVVVQTGGRGSHCAVLTRAMGIPAVVHPGDILQIIAPGDELLVDGLNGQVIARPDASKASSFRSRVRHYASIVSEARAKASEPAITLDGVTIPVMANVGGRDDVERALANGADGIGLYRIETFYLGLKSFPAEDELLDELGGVLEPLKGKPVCVRILDIGGDKPLPYLPLPLEPNPNLGRRGIRLLLDYPEVLRKQLRVLLRLSREHDLLILVPMVTVADDMRRVAGLLRETAAGLGIQEIPPLGAMIETPAAALYPDEIVAESNFVSLGTNDLTQFMMAADRENPLVARYYHEDHPSCLRAIEALCRRAQGMQVAVCGELAAESAALGRLLQAGVGLLSVAPPLVPLVKETIRNSTASQECRSGIPNMQAL